MAKGKSAKITIEFDVAGHPKVKKALQDLQKVVDGVTKGNAKLKNSVKSTTNANKKLNKSLVDTQRGLRNVGKDTKKLDSTFSVMRSKLLLVSFAFSMVSAAVLRFTKIAGDVEEEQNKFNVVFGHSALLVKQFADRMEEATGRSSVDIQAMAAGVQDILVPLGMMRHEAAQLSMEVTKTAVDVSSFTNVLQTDVIRDFNSALVGNHETVRKYGVMIDEARIKQFAYDMGLVESGKTIDNQSKVLARLAIIQADTTDTQGDAANTVDSFNNTLIQLNTEIKNTSITIGQTLQPVVKELAKGMTGLLKHIDPRMWTIIAIAVAGFAAKMLYARYSVLIFGAATKKAQLAADRLNKSIKRFLITIVLLEGINLVLKAFFPTVGEADDITDSLNKIDNATKELIGSFKTLPKEELLVKLEGAQELQKQLVSAQKAVKSLDGVLDSFSVNTLPTLKQGLFTVVDAITDLVYEADQWTLNDRERQALTSITISDTEKIVKKLKTLRTSLEAVAEATLDESDTAHDLWRNLTDVAGSSILASKSLDQVIESIAKGSGWGQKYIAELSKISINLQSLTSQNVVSGLTVISDLNRLLNPDFAADFNVEVIKLQFSMELLAQKTKALKEFEEFGQIADDTQIAIFAIETLGMTFDSLTDDMVEALNVVVQWNEAVNDLKVEKAITSLKHKSKALKANTEWEAVQHEFAARNITLTEAEAKEIAKLNAEIETQTTVIRTNNSAQRERESIIRDATTNEKTRAQDMIAEFKKLNAASIQAMGGKDVLDKVIAHLQKQIDDYDAQVLETAQREFAAVRALEEKRQTWQDTLASKAGKKAIAKHQEELKLIQTMLDEKKITEEQALDMKQEIMDKEIQQTATHNQNLYNMTMQSYQQIASVVNDFLSAKRSALGEDLSFEMDAMKSSLEFRRASSRKQQQMEDDKKAEFSQRNQELFKQEQDLKRANIIMNAADGVVKTIALLGLPAAWPFLAIQAGVTAAQLSLVNAQKPPKMAEGGLIGGQLHSQGGTLINAERGEFMLNRRAAESIGLENLNRMNQTGQAGNNINVNISGNVLSEDFVVENVVPIIKDRLRSYSGINLPLRMPLHDRKA